MSVGVKRQRVPYSQAASYRGNDYLLLEAISRELVNTARELSSSVDLQTTPQSPLASTQIYRAPGLVDYVRFRFQEARQRRVAGSFVPEDNSRRMAVVMSMYSGEYFGEMVWHHRVLSRPQVELVAARTSTINECFY